MELVLFREIQVPQKQGSKEVNMDFRKDDIILNYIQEAAQKCNVTVRRDSHTNSSKLGWGEIHVDLVMYTCASVASFAVFLRNVIGSLKDWRDLNRPHAERKIRVKLGERFVTIGEGDDLLEFVAEFDRKNRERDTNAT